MLPQYRSTAFGLLLSLVQGALGVIVALFLGELAQTYGLRPVMLWLITVPYAINALFRFLFYRPYPRDVERMQQELAAETSGAG